MEENRADRILSVIEREVGRVEDPAITFDELGLDSLELLDLLQQVENECGRKFSDEAIVQMHSISDILNACSVVN